MAVKYSLLCSVKMSPRLWLTGSLFLLHLGTSPVAEAEVADNKQYACQAGPTGGWSCSTSARSAKLPPKPGSAAIPVTAEERRAAEESSITQVSEAQGKALASRSADYSHLDWVPRDKLTAAQLAEVGPYCSGAYIEPNRPGLLDDTPKGQAPIHVSARASRHDENQEASVLAGDVVLRQGSMQVEAEEAKLYQLDNRGELAGNVRYRDKGSLMVGDRVELTLDSGEAKIENAEYVIHAARVRGSAQYAKREETSIIRLKDGTYTSCEPGDNTWFLHGNNVTLNPITGTGTATNVTIRVQDIPVFYTPYISFPIDDRRKSGFLTPSFGSSGRSGFGLLTPYYFNLAPNFDATLFPQYLAKRGMLLEGEFRYLTENTEGQVGGAFISDDEDERENQTGYQKQRWMYSWQHQTGLMSRWLAEVDYTDISDPYYFQDLSTNLKINQSDHLDQKAYLTYRGDSFVARLGVHSYERATVADITPYDRLPQFTLNGVLPFQPAGLVMDYSGEYVRFERDLRTGNFINENGNPEQWYDDRLRGLSRAEGSRIHIEPGVSLPLNWTWGFVKPTLKYAYTSYDIDLDNIGRNSLASYERYDDKPTRGLPIFSVDSGLYFDRDTQFFGQDFRQTLEPRLYYLYVSKDEQDDIPIFDTGEHSFNYASLWRDNRFSGRDRIGDANQVSLGLTTRLIEPSGFERQRFSIGQILYFRDREVQMWGTDYKNRSYATSSVSPYALEYLYRYNHDWRLSATFNWDPDSHMTRSSSAIFHYQPADNLNKIVNLGYRYRSETMRFDQATSTWRYDDDYGSPGTPEYIKDYYKISQHDFSTIWPMAPHWSVIARWQYDYNRNRTLETFGGFEYDSCCWKLRVIGRYWLNYDETSLNLDANDEGQTGIFFQIVLKGLGAPVGGELGTLFDKGIEGYREREEKASF